MIQNILSKLTRATFIGATALILAACGGGSGGTPIVSPNGPDLIITRASINTTTWVDGTSLVVEAEVANQGDATAGPSTAALYLSTNTIISTFDALLDAASTPSIASGSSDTVTFRYTVDASALGLSSGTYYLGILPDYTNQVSESNETNNDDFSVQSIVLTASKPDLTISSVSINDTEWVDGDSVTVSYTVKNDGASEAASSSTAIYLSKNINISSDDTKLATVSTAAIAAGGSLNGNSTFTVDVSTLSLSNGTYYIGVIPDDGSTVSELNEDNNDDYSETILASITVSGIADPQPSGVTSVDSDYTGRWGWRGDGSDGPRGVAVSPWGAAGQVSDFETAESYEMGGTTLHGGFYTADAGDPIGDIGARDAYALGLDGSGVVVAVIDSNIDVTHSELDDQFIANYDAAAGGSNGYDDHGTHVAGIIAAENGNGGMHGVAYGASLVGISIGDSSGLSFFSSDLANAINSAVNDGARIFNNSWSSSTTTSGSSSSMDSATLRASIANAIDAGAVFIWAAGNDYTANTNLGNYNTSEEAKAALEYDELMGGFVNVVNLRWDEDNSVWEIANSTTGASVPGNTWPDSQICGVTMHYCLGAPGTGITSSVVGGGYDDFSGTSMAAPTVAGGFAILFQAFPYVETADIMQLMFETATDLGAAGVDEVYGHGMMNLAAALAPVGSSTIPTTTSTDTNVGIEVTETTLVADAPLQAAIATAASDMVMLDDYDRAFVVGDLGVANIQPIAPGSANAVFASVDDDLANLSDFGSPITRAAVNAGALIIIGDRMALPTEVGTTEIVLNTVATEESGLAEFRYISSQSEEGWETSRSVGVIVEDDQLFGNKGTGAYALASSATTVSLGTSAQREISEGITVFGGLGLNRTEVSGADESLVTVSSHFTSASGLVGIRMSGLGEDETGEFAIQLGQDRAILSGDGSITVPVGREEDGVIVFDTVQLDSDTLGINPELMVSYSDSYSEDGSYSFSAAGTEEEAVISAQWLRNF